MSVDSKIAELLENARNFKPEEDVINETQLSEHDELDEATVVSKYDITGSPNHLAVLKHNSGLYSVAHRTTAGANVTSYDKNGKMSKIQPYSTNTQESAEAHAKRLKARLESPTQEDYSIDMSDDINALTEGEGLSEEFKSKAATIFEAAVISRVKQEYSRIEEEFDNRLDEQVETIKEGLIEKVDGYLDYVIEEWITQNEIALENSLKNEIFESFISGMKNLFEQHYIDIPEEEFDVVSELSEQVKSTEEKLNEQFNNNVELKRQLIEMKRNNAINKISEGLPDTDVDKFKELAEELSFQSDETFETKLQTIKESYFGKKPSNKTFGSPVSDTPILNEEVSTNLNIDPKMAAYLKAINKK